MKDYKTLLGDSSGEFVVDKSRFIGSGFFVDSVERADELIREVKKKYYDATHNCYAYIIGESFEYLKSSDDGEPSSTAGKPMLDYLSNNGLTNCLVVATRYFGGVKLGTGGLVRAYTECAKVAIEGNTIVEKRSHQKICLGFDYTNIGRIQSYINSKEIAFDQLDFAEDVRVNIYVRKENVAGVIKDLKDLTSATMSIKLLDEIYLNFIDGKFDKESTVFF